MITGDGIMINEQYLHLLRGWSRAVGVK